jgi:hypothetical protein
MAKEAKGGGKKAGSRIVSGNGVKAGGKFEMTGKRYTKLPGFGGKR